LTPDSAGRARRLVEAARCASVAGADAHAVELAERAGLAVHDPIARAELASVIGLAETRQGRPANAPGPLISAAREVATLDPGRALDLLLDAAWAATEDGDPKVQREIYQVAAGLTGSTLDDRAAFILRLLKGLGAIAAGDVETAADELGVVIAAGAEYEDPRHVIWAGSAALGLSDEVRAGALFARGAALARRQGELGILVVALPVIGLHKFVAQQFDQAAVAAVEAEKLTRDVGAENMLALTKFVLAAVAAIRGRDEEAQLHVDEALVICRAHGLSLGVARLPWALALVDLGRGRWEQALTRLESIPLARMGIAGGLGIRSIPDRVEAAVRAGRPDAARSALLAFERWAATVNVPLVWPRLASCRALLTEGSEATRYFDKAIALSADALPFDLARIHLLYGEHLRRERRRTDSRLQLRAALEGFERLGAEPWVERARAELRASGETARRRDPSTLSQLTPQELQIARFVAEGMSNKQVAAQLFLSPRTIDSHLRNIFSKLAISSRTQLARLPLGDDAVAVAV
jgi:DNA-binding CsgD family transcriptional regulator